MCELTCVFRVELGHDAQREHLAELDAPLIEAVDVPDRALREHAVFIQGDEGSKRVRSRALGENHIGRAFPSKTRNGACQSGTPSAATSSGVLPKASASA